MASESLSGGGWLLTASTSFFTTFEVKTEMENASTLQYANYWIVMELINMLKPEAVVSSIEAAQAAGEGIKLTLEGVVTSNASGYDKNTAFFDCIYIQDKTGGINLFPVDGSFKIGDVVRVTGVTGSYNGERELIVSSIEKIGEADPVKPKELSAKDAMSGKYLGQLIKVSGTVYSLGYATDGTLDTIMVKDSAGDLARVFIDGYIMFDYKGLDKIKVGDNISAIGIGSITVDTASANGGNIPRLRVRDRSEIVYSTPEGGSPQTGDNSMGGVFATLCILSVSCFIFIKKRRAEDNRN
jgi:DNA/RNA endonuclease YhcR with UshA esterase domain